MYWGRHNKLFTLACVAGGISRASAIGFEAENASGEAVRGLVKSRMAAGARSRIPPATQGMFTHAKTFHQLTATASHHD